MRHYFTTFILLVFAVTVNAESDFPPIQKLMSEQQFEDAGLTKLTAAEIAVLEKWLASYTANEAPVIKKTSEAVKKLERELLVESSIAGKFAGWRGKTEFPLANGQLWRQRLSGKYHYKSDNPEVVIRRNALGFHVMEIVETGKKIGVKRIR